MKLIFQALILTVSMALSTPGMADTFCDSLKKVRAQSTSNFDETNAGAKNDAKFYVRDTLNGFRECSLLAFRGGQRSYICQTDLVDAKSLEAELWKQVTRAERCLGSAVSLLGERTGTSAALQAHDELGWIFINSMPFAEFDAATRNPVMGDVITLSVQPVRPARDDTSEPQEEPVRAGTPSKYAATAQFCPKLMSVIAAAEKQFNVIIKQGNETNGWDTSLKLPTLSSCRVLNGFRNARYYSCTGSEQPDAQTSSQDQEALRELFDACLDDDWEFKVRTNDDDTKRIKVWKGDYQPTIEIRQRKPTLEGGDWVVKVDIEVPDKTP